MVFVLSHDKQPLDPTTERRARLLLKNGKAAVFRRYPFTLILKERLAATSQTHHHRLKIDPGSKTTGLAIVRERRVVWAGELTHRGQQIRERLVARRILRRGRRSRKTRYRKMRCRNRRRPEGWLAPSLQHCVLTTSTWIRRLRAVCPITALSLELVRFDTQLLQNAEISGVNYQQGGLAGYEVREYLLEKWGRKCAYCGREGVPLQVEHLIPKARGGTDRVSSLTLACEPCNRKKGSQTATEFGYPELMAKAKQSLKDAAAVNATRWSLWRTLKANGLPLETGSGGRTKWNRSRLGLPKAHWVDAACVGASTPDGLSTRGVQPLLIAAKGHGTRQMCRTNKHGVPIPHVPRQKRHFGFRTGDLVKAVVSRGKYAGMHVGRVAVRQTGSFNITTEAGLMQGIGYRHCQIVQRADGYAYTTRKEERAFSAA
jgi:5-methylcytosine-specific restriction endonuclease McrA